MSLSQINVSTESIKSLNFFEPLQMTQLNFFPQAIQHVRIFECTHSAEVILKRNSFNRFWSQSCDHFEYCGGRINMAWWPWQHL